MDNLVHFLGADYKPITQPVDTYSSLSYEKKWDEYGNFKFVAAPSLFPSIKDAKRVRVNGNTFLLDNIITKDATANNELSVSGRSLEALLDKVVNPTPLRIRGNLEVQVRAVVTALAITGVQAQAKLALGTLHGYLNSIDTVVPRGSLGLWLYTTLNQRGFTYTLNYVQATDTVVFDIVQEVDRSTTAVFSTQKYNIENLEYSKSDTDACNFAVVYDDETGEVVYVDESNGEEKRALLVQGKSANTADDFKLFVMIGFDKRSVYTSTDGNGFTLKYTFDSTVTLHGIAYHAGLFVACGYDSRISKGIIVTSSDAVSWTVSKSDSILDFYEVVYNDGIFVVIGKVYADGYYGAASILTSFDAVTFETTYLGGDTCESKPSYANGKWFVCASNASTNDIIIYRSIYGFDWERLSFDAPTSESSSTPQVIMYNVLNTGTELVAVGYINPVGADVGDFLIAKSIDDFETCTITTINTAYAHTAPRTSVCNGNNIVLSCDSGIAYSTDGCATINTASLSISIAAGGLVAHDGSVYHVFGAEESTGDMKHVYSDNIIDWIIVDIPTISDRTRRGTYGASTQIMSMRDIGRAELSKNRSVEVIDGDVLPGVAPIIGTDCNIGDIAGVVDIKRGIIATKRLVSAKTVVEKQAHYTIPKFGADYLSLTKYIAKEIAKNV